MKGIIRLVAVVLLAGALVSAASAREQPTRVRRVVDGDTLVTATGETIRLLGVDAPEAAEPYHREATEALHKMVTGKDVRIKACREKDPYERTLAVVLVDGLNANLELIRRGLARPLLIPPCGRAIADSVLKTAAGAVVEREGLFSTSEFAPIFHYRAAEKTGVRAAVVGTVRSVHRGPQAVHLNFGNDWRTDFTAVIFRGSLQRFRELGQEPADLHGRRVLVLGRVRQYNGPEIILRGPEQILPLPQ